MVKEFFQQIHTVEEDILERYLDEWEEKVIPSRTIVTPAGKTEHYLYFVLEGIQKSYHLNDGKQHVIAFTYPPSPSGIPESFLSQQPSKYYLETITESRFLRISYEQHIQMMAEYRPIETLVRKMTEQVLIGVLERQYELMAFSMEERFRSFMGRSAHLLNKVSQKDLASYLRIDPTNFSKLLSRIKI